MIIGDHYFNFLHNIVSETEADDFLENFFFFKLDWLENQEIFDNHKMSSPTLLTFTSNIFQIQSY